MESRGPPRVKNKAAAPIQISAEQLLREAVDRQEQSLQTPTTKISDLEELHEFQGRKRRDFENYVRRNRLNVHNWTSYAKWEIEQKEFARGRSVFERALDVNPQDVRLWITYIRSEIESRSINHARNLLDRAVSVLPRQSKLWLEYVGMEETLGAFDNCRRVFERWMEWRPDPMAWSKYIAFEKRYGEFERVRDIYERFVAVHPEPRHWIKWAEFEEQFGTGELVREVYGLAIDTLQSMGGIEFLDEKLFVAYAKFESKLREYERSRAIYKYGLDQLPRSKAEALHQNYTKFEKQFGDREGVEDAILTKRRVLYEQELKQSPQDYDAWINLAKLEEDAGDPERTREVYERAIGQKPASLQKRHWRRYIYLWIFYALYEEIDQHDVDRARAIYAACLQQIPHQHFSFAKIWLQAAMLELRHGELTKFRKLLGRALGTCYRHPKNKLYREYIAIELKLFEFGNCRTLYEQWVKSMPHNANAWIKWAELERGLDEAARARAIFALAIEQDQIDMPELVWKAYIDFEEDEGEYERVVALYERLLQRTNHFKVWISYAQSTLNQPAPGAEDEDEDEEDDDAERPVPVEAIARARKIFERANAGYKDAGADDLDARKSRVELLRAWKSFEDAHGSEADRAAINKQMPRSVKKRRKLDDDTFEEYMDFVFPADDEGNAKLARLLERSAAWKREQEAKAAAAAAAAAASTQESES